MGNIFDFLVVNPMTNTMLLLYGLFNNYVVALVLLTVIIRLLTLPLNLKQMVSSIKMAALQPQMKALQEKYKNDPQTLSAEMRKLGFNPLAGCLPTLIQFPILIGLYNAIMRTMAVNPFSLLELGKHVYSFLPGLSSLVPINSQFLVWDLGQPDPFFVTPILVVATTYFSTKVTMMPTTDPQMKQTNQMMSWMMPVMFGFFMLSAPVGLGIYWVVSNLIGIGQYYLMKPRLELARAQHAAPTAAPTATPAAAPAPKAPPPKSKVKPKTTVRISKPSAESGKK
ncbi:MAG: YidC/Oxa1 family membrane protein insertase [Anaerolineae bacterium]|nr:YidC/Oxa1 family membrane protein insertase [Thermoflexales bacterium]MDW8408523.1 YidC/Oxa1 family membrane protein insertase [Anaerolineae bacterium]